MCLSTNQHSVHLPDRSSDFLSSKIFVFIFVFNFVLVLISFLLVIFSFTGHWTASRIIGLMLIVDHFTFVNQFLVFMCYTKLAAVLSVFECITCHIVSHHITLAVGCFTPAVLPHLCLWTTQRAYRAVTPLFCHFLSSY